jgi:hypothetical protein
MFWWISEARLIILPQMAALNENNPSRLAAPLCVNGDATESFRGQSVVEMSLFCHLWEDVSYLYTPAADTYLLHCLPAGAVYFWLFYRYICLFHHR